jgi:hypothetical protein
MLSCTLAGVVIGDDAELAIQRAMIEAEETLRL